MKKDMKYEINGICFWLMMLVAWIGLIMDNLFVALTSYAVASVFYITSTIIEEIRSIKNV